MQAAHVVGIVLAVVVAVFGRLSRFDRDRAFYPTVTVVVASYYVLFAAIGGSLPVVLLEAAFMLVFVSAAVIGFRSSAWFVAAALAGHGVFDGLHGYIVGNPGLPETWPAFCLAYDVTAAAGLGWLLLARRSAGNGENRNPITNEMAA